MFTLMRKEEKNYNSTLNLFISTQINVENLKIICISEGRCTTAYKLYDSNNEFLGRRSFDCYLFPIIGLFTKALTEDLNVLFDNQLKYEHIGPIAEIAINKCESRYGNAIDGGDCVLYIKFDNLNEEEF